MASYKLVTGDMFDLPITITKSDGTTQDLTGASVKFLIRNMSTGFNTNDANNACTITSTTGGTCTYSFLATDLPTPATYEADVKITFAGAKPRTIYKQAEMLVRQGN